jgi:hypothetical protein
MRDFERIGARRLKFTGDSGFEAWQSGDHDITGNQGELDGLSDGRGFLQASFRPL